MSNMDDFSDLLSIFETGIEEEATPPAPVTDSSPVIRLHINSLGKVDLEQVSGKPLDDAAEHQLRNRLAEVYSLKEAIAVANSKGIVVHENSISLEGFSAESLVLQVTGYRIDEIKSDARIIRAQAEVTRVLSTLPQECREDVELAILKAGLHPLCISTDEKRLPERLVQWNGAAPEAQELALQSGWDCVEQYLGKLEQSGIQLVVEDSLIASAATEQACQGRPNVMKLAETYRQQLASPAEAANPQSNQTDLFFGDLFDNSGEEPQSSSVEAEPEQHAPPSADPKYIRDPQLALEKAQALFGDQVRQYHHGDWPKHGYYITTGDQQQRYTLRAAEDHRFISNLTENPEYALRQAVNLAGYQPVYFDASLKLRPIEREMTGRYAGADDEPAKDPLDVTITFGKYIGKTVRAVLKDDPDYITYLEGNGPKKASVKLKEALKTAFEEAQTQEQAKADQIAETPDLTVEMEFGKHAGRSVQELLGVDPGYLDWLGAQTLRCSSELKAAIKHACELKADRENTALAENKQDCLGALNRHCVRVTSHKEGNIRIYDLPQNIGQTLISKEIRQSLPTATPLYWNRTEKCFVGEMRSPGDVDTAKIKIGYALLQAEQRQAALVDKAMSKPVQRISDEEARQRVGSEVTRLIMRGREAGIQQHVLENQLADIGHALHAYENDQPAFLIANEAGTGKSFVLGGILHELKRVNGVTEAAFLTMNQDLVSQLKRDLADYDLDHVTFTTYANLRENGLAMADGVLVADEAHNLMNIQSETGKIGQAVIRQQKFFIPASATPYETPLEAEYLAASGIFEANDFRSFGEWAKTFGAIEVPINRYVNSYRWPDNSTELAKTARQWLIDRGVFTQRPMELPAHQIRNDFRPVKASPNMVELYQKVERAYESILEAVDDQYPYTRNIKDHRENTLKRLTESAKVEANTAIALDAIRRGRYPLIFVETKSAKHLGRFRKMGDTSGPLYSPDEMIEMMAEWEAEKQMGLNAGMDAPPPFANWIVDIARAFQEHGIDVELPSVVDQYKTALGNNAAVYTGSGSGQQNEKELESWRSGEKAALISTMAKGGTGMSYHDTTGNHPTTMIVSILPWSSRIMKQVAGRNARYGLVGTAEIVWTMAPDFRIEQKLGARVMKRMKDMGAVVSGVDHEYVDQIQDALEQEATHLPASPDFQLRMGDISVHDYLESKGIDPDEVDTLTLKDQAKRLANAQSPFMQALNDLETAALDMKSLHKEGKATAAGRLVLSHIESARQNMTNPLDAKDDFPKGLVKRFEKRMATLAESAASDRRALQDTLYIELLIEKAAVTEKKPEANANPGSTKHSPESQAPEHSGIEKKALDPENVYPRPESLETADIPLDEGVLEDLAVPVEDFRQWLDEFSYLMADPEAKTMAGPMKTPEPGSGTFVDIEESRTRREEWSKRAEAQFSDPSIRGRNSDKAIISLFDHTGNWSRPWAEAGYNVVRVDLQDGIDVNDFSAGYLMEWAADQGIDAANVYGMLIAAPCTDFANSGARWFKEKDQDGRTEASKNLVFQALKSVEFFRPKFWVLENPTGRIQRLTNLPKARYSFHPWHFGEDYTKATQLYGRFEVDLPTAPVYPTAGSKMHTQFGGASLATKNARSETAAGFADAFFMANNYEDLAPEKRLVMDFIQIKSAISEAIDSGLPEPLIRRLVEHDYHNEDLAQCLSNLAGAVKSVQQGVLPEVLMADAQGSESGLEDPQKPDQGQASDLSTAKPNRIEDLGYIPGAAKERWEKMLVAYEMEYGDSEMAAMSLSKILPEPNYERLAEDGVNARLLAFMAVVRANVPAKPRKTYKLRQWVVAVKDARSLIGTALTEGDGFLSVLESHVDHYELLVKQYSDLHQTLEAEDDLTREQVIKEQLRDKRQEISRAKNLATLELKINALMTLTDKPVLYPKIARKLWVDVSFSHEGNNTSVSAFHKMAWSDEFITYGETGRLNDVASTLNAMQEKHPSMRQQLEAILTNEGGNTVRTKTDEIERIKKAINIYRDYKTNQIVAMYKGTTKDNMYELAVYTGDPKSRSEKRAWFSQNLDAWAQQVQQDRQFVLRGQENSPRQGGKDWRQDRDISPQEFAEHFGLSSQRALQYGNSLIKAQKEAQARTNEAFDALNDLAEILNLSPQALSLGGELAFAFGARGRGGRNPAMAHFEPGQFIINLTRKSGAGSLAHEWFHALDNHFAKQYQPGVDLEAIPATRTGSFATRHWHTLPAEDEVMRASVAERFSELVKAFEGTPGMVHKDLKSPYYRASLQMDAAMNKKEPYWASTIELAARAFEAYCQDRMTELGMSNDFLVNLQDNRDDPEMRSVVPGRQAMEKLGIREAFDNLFQALEVYQTQDNRLILHRLDSDERQSVATLMDIVGQDPDFFRYHHQEGQNLAEMFERYGYQVKVSDTDFWWEGMSATEDEVRTDHLQDVSRLYECHTSTGMYFVVYETEQQLWMDLSGLGGDVVKLASGERMALGGVGGGNEIYQLVANYCYNTGKQLVGDPEGLSDTAVVRRTESMISSALRYGTTAHFLPSDQQRKGEDKKGNRIPGVAPLAWGNDDTENLSNLIKVSYTALNNLIPEVAGVYFDEERSEFRVRESAAGLFPNATGLAQVLNEGRREPFEAGRPWRRLETVLGRELPPLARAMAGSATLKRAIVIHSVLSDTRGKVRGEDLARARHELFTEFAAIHTLRGKFYRDTEASSKQIIEDHHFENVVQWTREVEEATGASITVVEDSADLPARLAKAIKPATKGIYDFASGKAYLIADRLVGRTDTIKTALHEGLGHQGLIHFLERNADRGGARMLRLLDNIAAGVGDEAIQARVGRYGFDLNQRADRHQAVLEYIAHLAEDSERPDLVRRVVNAQTNVLTNTFSGIVWTQNDVLDLIEAAKLYRVRQQAMEAEVDISESLERIAERREEIFWQAIQDAGGDRLATLLGAKAPVHMALAESFTRPDPAIHFPEADCFLMDGDLETQLQRALQLDRSFHEQHPDVKAALEQLGVNDAALNGQAIWEHLVVSIERQSPLSQRLADAIEKGASPSETAAAALASVGIVAAVTQWGAVVPYTEEPVLESKTAIDRETVIDYLREEQAKSSVAQNWVERQGGLPVQALNGAIIRSTHQEAADNVGTMLSKLNDNRGDKFRVLDILVSGNSAVMAGERIGRTSVFHRLDDAIDVAGETSPTQRHQHGQLYRLNTQPEMADGAYGVLVSPSELATANRLSQTSAEATALCDAARAVFGTDAGPIVQAIDLMHRSPDSSLSGAIASAYERANADQKSALDHQSETVIDTLEKAQSRLRTAQEQVAEPQLLQWDIALKDQPAGIREAVARAFQNALADRGGETALSRSGHKTGQQIYGMLAGFAGSDRAASAYLHGAGITGLLDKEQLVLIDPHYADQIALPTLSPASFELTSDASLKATLLGYDTAPMYMVQPTADTQSPFMMSSHPSLTSASVLPPEPWWVSLEGRQNLGQEAFEVLLASESEQEALRMTGCRVATHYHRQGMTALVLDPSAVVPAQDYPLKADQFLSASSELPELHRQSGLSTEDTWYAKLEDPLAAVCPAEGMGPLGAGIYLSSDKNEAPSMSASPQASLLLEAPTSMAAGDHATFLTRPVPALQITDAGLFFDGASIGPTHGQWLKALKTTGIPFAGKTAMDIDRILDGDVRSAEGAIALLEKHGGLPALHALADSLGTPYIDLAPGTVGNRSTMRMATSASSIRHEQAVISAELLNTENPIKSTLEAAGFDTSMRGGAVITQGFEVAETSTQCLTGLEDIYRADGYRMAVLDVHGVYDAEAFMRFVQTLSTPEAASGVDALRFGTGAMPTAYMRSVVEELGARPAAGGYVLSVSERARRAEAVSTRFLFLGRGALQSGPGQTWFKGADGLDRFEISDENAALLPECKRLIKAAVNGKDSYSDLGSLLRHDELFVNYPGMKDVEVYIRPNNEKGAAPLSGWALAQHHWDAKATQIALYVTEETTHEGAIELLLHEVQHVIQTAEGFALGGSSKASYEYLFNNLEVGERNIVTSPEYLEARAIAAELDQARALEQYKFWVDFATKDEPTRQARLVYSSQHYMMNVRDIIDEFGMPPPKRKRFQHAEWLRSVALKFANDIANEQPGSVGHPRDNIRSLETEHGPNAVKNLVRRLERRYEKTLPIRRHLTEVQQRQRTLETVTQFESSTFRSSREKVYRHLAGEVEARNVMTRRTMSKADRLAQPPVQTEDIPRHEQLVDQNMVGIKPWREGKAPTDRLLESLQGINVQLVSSIDDLPEAAAMDARRMGFDCVAGAQCGNQLYVVGEQYSEQQLEEVILHETAHAGVKSVMGKAMSRTYGRFYMRMGQDLGLQREAKTLGVDLSPYVAAGDRLVASKTISPTQRAEMLVDEFMAHAVQTRARERLSDKAGRLMKEFVGGIRNTLRRHGLLHTSQFTSTDLAYTLKQVHRAAMGRSHETPLILTHRTAEERESDAARLEQALAEITGTGNKQSLVEIMATAPEPGNNPVATAMAVAEQQGIMFTHEQVLNALRENYDIKENTDHHAKDVFWIIRDRLSVAPPSEWATIVLAGENALECVEHEISYLAGTGMELDAERSHAKPAEIDQTETPVI